MHAAELESANSDRPPEAAAARIERFDRSIHATDTTLRRRTRSKPPAKFSAGTKADFSHSGPGRSTRNSPIA